MCSRKWLMAALVVCGLASACSQYNTNLTIQTSSSSVAFLSPSAATAGASGFPITVSGAGFVSGATIMWNVGPGQTQTALTTTLVSAVQLTAFVPASLLTSAGAVQVAVRIPGSATSPTTNIYNTTTTELSNIVYFTIGSVPATPPAIVSMSPLFAPYCNSSGFTLTVNAATGTTFSSDSIVNWNNAPLATTVATPTQLTALVTPANAAFPGPVVVSVTNSAGTSNSLPFTMVAPTSNLPQPALSSVSPTTALAGSPALAVKIDGASFQYCTSVKWTAGGVTSTLPTTYVPAGQDPTDLAIHLVATVPAGDLLSAGTAVVDVFTPGPGGGTSTVTATPKTGPIAFTISPPPTPTITSVTGTSNISCSATGITLTVNGTNFLATSVVDWNGSPRHTTFVPATQTVPAYLTAIISPTDTASAGSASITVSNFAVTSAPASFAISAPATAPLPSITTISQTRATAGTAGFNLVVTGGNFLPCSAVQWGGAGLTTVFSSPTQLTATIPATDILNVATVQITVFNPASGGGASSTGVPLSIVAPAITSLLASTTSSSTTPSCSVTGLTLAVAGTDFVNGLVVNWNGSPRATTFVSATQLTALVTVADTTFPGTAAITVSTPTVTSNSSTFTIAASSALPVPAITSLSPSSAVIATGNFSLSVTGRGFVPCSAIQWNGSGANLTTLYIGTTGVSATIPAADISSSGTAQVTVANPTAGGGGGLSNAFPFPIFATPAPAARIVPLVQAAVIASSDTAASLATPYRSADNRYAVFVLASTDGVTEIPGSTENIFVRDTCTGAPEGCAPSIAMESIGFNSNPSDGNSISPAIGADGRYVTFISSATNLVVSDTNGAADVFVRDTCAGVVSGCTPATRPVSVATDGTQANGDSASATISGNGRYITFRSAATNLDPASSAASGLYLRDTCAGAPSGCTPSTHQLN